MQWTRPTWPIVFDFVGYGIGLLIVLAAGLSHAFGW